MKIVVLDCDGTLRPIDKLIKVTLEYLGEYFNIQIVEGEIAKNVSSLSGGTFREAYFKALEFFAPGYDKERAEQCYRALSEKRTAIYREVEPFPEVIDTLENLYGNYYLVISTGLEKEYIEEWLKRINIISLFGEIYGGEDGDKVNHIRLIRQKHPGDEIYFVGDATLEMQLGVPAIGVARDSSQEQPLMMAGARAVIRSLNELIDLDLDSLRSDSGG